MTDRTIEVFADITCPFTHVGLQRFVAARSALGRREPFLRVRAWPLELVNDEPLRGPAVAGKVEMLRRSVAPDLFAGFRPDRFPESTRAALASAHAAYRLGLPVGELFSSSVRVALFEQGHDISREAVLADIRAEHGVEPPAAADVDSIAEDLEEGRRRGVIGSPHFFTERGDFFCPSLEISHEGDALIVSFDPAGFERFMSAAFEA